jgi:hypothetical protein
MIATLERILRLQRGLTAKRAAVAVAEEEFEATSLGTAKRQLARQAVADAKRALAAQEAELEELQASLPAPGNMDFFYSKVAAYRVARSDLEKAIQVKEKELEEEKERQKTQVWKWQGRKDAPPPKEVVAIEAAILKLEKQIAEADEEVRETLAFVAHVDRRAEEAAEVAAWEASGYESPRPECIVRAEKEFAEELASECDHLQLRGQLHRIAARNTWADPPSAEDEAEWGTPMDVEGYLNILMPPPAKAKEVKIRVGNGMSLQMREMVARRAAARAAKQVAV